MDLVAWEWPPPAQHMEHDMTRTRRTLEDLYDKYRACAEDSDSQEMARLFRGKAMAISESLYHLGLISALDRRTTWN